ncbi:uncharacterized protein N7503_006256 [Penicillium pulvis]|uniref:uncharacterized protein n=1 Tax=Penicillium pulvis TaxID=1562058 RepID=UPI00254805A7|nr:uncharacterized protein N7503_006256 [Penicillium pulvis]KAJ5798751.1 hypothetical protein N7503_006256 [Penicillium pulvis]
MANYYNMQAVREEIDRVPRAGHESIVYGVWNAILSSIFTPQNGYIVRPQDVHTSQSGARGYSDLHVFHYLPGARRATKFLIVQCKRAGGETQPSVWREGVAQLHQYTAATHGIRAVPDRRPVYGIVAIGNCLRFYYYHEASSTIRDFWRSSVHPNPRLGGICDHKTHHDFIREMLIHIRTNH